jgi:Acyl-protein synthetase, LuxE
MICELEHKIFTLEYTEFEAVALATFRFQYSQNNTYRQYVNQLGIDPSSVATIEKIPFLPIDFFKTHRIVTSEFTYEAFFETSGTTQIVPGRHYIKDLSLYRQSFEKGFERCYGPVKNWCILGLLPSYLERKNSSLVMMVNELIRMSQHEQSGFYLYEYEKLFEILQELERQQRKTLLIGVSFALLDFSERFSQPLKHTTLMETGGMKGRREEMTRAELHAILRRSWGLQAIHSEYGMTELLSQAYSKGEGIFECPPWMKIILREEDDPLRLHRRGRGLINIIDLANIYSCSFIATDDIGIVHPDASFEVMGRRDNSDLRGCSLLYHDA